MKNKNAIFFLTSFIVGLLLVECDVYENDISHSMVTIIPKGKQSKFIMGSTDSELMSQPSMDHPDYITDDEQPAHEVLLTVPYELASYETTNSQYCQVMNYAIKSKKAEILNGDLRGKNGLLYLGITNLDTSAKYLGIQYGIEISDDSLNVIKDCENQPVHGVTWYGAIAYCNILSEIKGLSTVYNMDSITWDAAKNGFRLPTEAEWEYAARKDKRYTYAWGNHIDSSYLNYYPTQTANYDKSTGKFDVSVFKSVGFFNGELRNGIETNNNASPFGIYDMNGNVWEWCWDWYGREYYKFSPERDPKGPFEGDDRPPYDIDKPTKVWRGCGWAGNEAFSRIAKRWSASPETVINEVGFRIARTL